MAIEFAGKQGSDLSKGKSTGMSTTGMGGKGKIDSPVSNFPSVSNSTSMPTGKVTGKTAIDSPVSGL